ncbi:hypothetical protein BHE74_00003907 [Ensete ventricosum]|nr:hypothetical protein BHE74_00003907 [Ensete ventricosum]RZR81506.1 hypothetical protein BHM03_00007753 [Ensete ventricosum]
MARFALPGSKAPYQAVLTGPPADRYADRPLPSGTVEIDSRRSISTGISRGREKEEEGENLVPQRAALPRFPRAIYRQWAKNCPRDPSPVAGGRFLLPARGEGI